MKFREPRIIVAKTLSEQVQRGKAGHKRVYGRRGRENIVSLKIDVSVDDFQARKLGILKVPTWILFDSYGKEVKRQVGFMNYEEVWHFARLDKTFIGRQLK